MGLTYANHFGQITLPEASGLSDARNVVHPRIIQHVCIAVEYGSGIIILDPHVPDAYLWPMLTLRDYILTNRVRQKDLAARLGVTQATVSRLVTGAAKPSFELAAAIKRETGGDVGFEVWVTSFSSPAAPAAPTQEHSHEPTPKA